MYSPDHAHFETYVQSAAHFVATRPIGFEELAKNIAHRATRRFHRYAREIAWVRKSATPTLSYFLVRPCISLVPFAVAWPSSRVETAFGSGRCKGAMFLTCCFVKLVTNSVKVSSFVAADFPKRCKTCFRGLSRTESVAPVRVLPSRSLSTRFSS